MNTPKLTTKKSPKLTTQEVAEIYRKHPVTVRLALSDQSLHGEQTKFGGRWIIDEACADAWARGEKCEHHQKIVQLRRQTPAKKTA